MGIKDQKKSNPALSFKILHKLYLMCMDICKWERIRIAFLRIEADRNSLYGTDIIDRTFLFKVSKGDVPCLLVNIDRGDRRRNLLYQCQMIFQILFICPVNLSTGQMKSICKIIWH